jgi:hypothetical protein
MKALLAALLMCCTLLAHAGRSCEARLPDASAVQRGLELAARTAQALDDSGAEVVVLARAGQDLSRYGLRWSHMGLAYRDEEGWRVVHKLNQCGSATAQLYRQGLAEFFLDDPFEYRAVFAVLGVETQQRLNAMLRDNEQVTRLHTEAYNMVAYPWSQTYQQSNQWALELLAMSQERSATTRERAQAWLKFKGYEPTTLRLGAFTRLGARMTAANVAFDDHPNDKRFSDRIETVTVDSVLSFLRRTSLIQGTRELR